MSISMQSKLHKEKCMVEGKGKSYGDVRSTEQTFPAQLFVNP